MDQTSIVFGLTAVVFFAIMLVFVFFGTFSIYILVRYGRSKTLSLTLAAIYGLFFIVLFINSFNTLLHLK